jgi:DNA-binding response OmpR family regulator
MANNQESESSDYTILVVDDEELVRTLVATILSKLGHSCLSAINGVDALEKMKGHKIDAVITDVKMPQMDGIILTRELSTRYPGLPIMVMTAFDEEYSGGTALSMGAREFIKKPFSLDEFAIRLQKMMRDAEAFKQARAERPKRVAFEGLQKEPQAAEPVRPVKAEKVEKEPETNIEDLMDELEKTLKNN